MRTRAIATPRCRLAGPIGVLAALTWFAPLAAQDPDAPGRPAPTEADTLTLAEALAAALATHPLLDRADASVEAAEADVRIAGAAQLPQAAITASTTRFAEPMVVAPLHGFDPSRPPSFDRTLIQGRAEMSYRLFDGGALGARRDAARAGAAASEADRRGAREQVLAGVTVAYATVAAARLRYDAASLRSAAAMEAKASADRQFAEGAIAEVETLRAEGERLASEAAIARTLWSLDLARRELARWMGLDSLPRRSVRHLTVDVERLVPGDTLPSVAIERAQRGVQLAAAEVSAARAGRSPRFDVRAAILEFGSADGDFQSEWQAGLAVHLPAFTGGATGAGIDRARAGSRAAAANLALARLRRASALDEARTNLIATQVLMDALRQRVDTLEEVWRIALLAAEEGVGTRRESLEAGADTYDASAALADARVERVRAAVAFGRARGILTESWILQVLESSP